MNPMSTEAPPTRGGVILGGLCSLAFWLCLFTAAALYAAVVLSAKLCTYGALQAEHESNQWRLVALEKQGEHLRQVIEAQKDPAFVREQARADFDMSRADEQRIPVDSHLTLHIGPASGTTPARRVEPPAYARPARAIAASRRLGNGMLAAAAALVVAAFTLLPARK